MRWSWALLTSVGVGCVAAVPAPAREPAPVPILMYHHVAPAPSASGDAERLWVAPERFERQVRALAREGYQAVTLGRAWRGWHGSAALPREPVVLSFDDGYADQFGNAAPVLAAHGWPGVLNLTASRLGEPEGIARADAIALVEQGWEIGAHSVTHPDLTRVGAARLGREVAGSRRRLERVLDVPVKFFAYPHGRADRRVRAAVTAAGFLAATTIRFGAATRSDDRFALRRIFVTGDTTPAMLLRSIGRARRLARARAGT